ncbi:MAG: bifunctional [glutamate--ammonia ligase]-adenylyl-L-tyrosine phosphorylase/[glutamate--ammonia-ligase] adenylyltransferase, partial [Paraburkholderia sp.]|nr:bifunctional [glutamate--ammonia ligase]-adenylyl-L-tyrosine phosphorylase/[glutamate--ammonia-ligase] adenylyltransferase [Paraburkholderia sp.]
LAEVAIQRALACVSADLEALFGEPRGPNGERLTLGVVGMGKLGGRELNVSSDIDLIFVYEDDGETSGGQRSPIATQDFFTRVGKRLIGALSDVTADGFVFRVDMRLRPNGDSGPLVCSLGMLEEYFYVQGREWERYAWIKGRLVSEVESESALRLARQLDSLVKPFVYRRYLDFGVISAIRSLHVQIRQEAQRRAMMRPDKADDIKLGRGGIREIEFSAQVFQLIRGGQDAGFRVRPTLAVLGYAAARGLISLEVCGELTRAYDFLRSLEHRLQYRDDAQTHAMPVDAEERAALARSMGFADYAALISTLDGHREKVERQFVQIFSDKVGGEGGCGASGDGAAAWVWSGALVEEGADDELVERLAQLGIDDPAPLLARLRGLWQSSRYAGLPEKSRERFDGVAQRALEAARTLEPRERRGDTLARMFELLEGVIRRGAYLALLTEYPDALNRVLNVLGGSRWAAGYLIRHPQLLDELLDDEAVTTPFDWPEFSRLLRARLAAAADVEQQMDLLRHAHQAEVFRILLNDLAGRLSVEHVSDRLSELADAVLDVTIETVWKQFARRHREVPRFAAIAYGKLGGKELGYASDLDIIFLYDDDHERAPEVYASFARKLITWLTSHTAAGTLFDVDTRLRPNGAAGLMVTHFEAFRRYQMREGDNAAWVWEHQALTRARFCAGDAEIGARFEALRTAVLRQAREADPLRDEIVAMRERVLEGHANPTELFDLKHDRGGMVDIEFTVQFLVLLHSAAHAELTRNKGNIALLHMASALGLTDAARAAQVADAYRDFRARQHKLRLDGQSAARVPAGTCAHEAAHVRALWEQVFGTAPASSSSHAG